MIGACGGQPAWDATATASYDLVWKFGDAILKDRQLFDLQSCHDLITAADGSYTIGMNAGDEVWMAPGPDAITPLLPGFYIWTVFYFFAILFVFGDEGVNIEVLGKPTFKGAEYDGLTATFSIRCW